MKALTIAGGLAALWLAACGAPPSPPPQVAEPLDRAPSGWMEFNPEPTLIDGQLISASCSGAPGADPAFRFWAKRGTSDRLVVFFDGGGACWDDATCAAPGLHDAEPGGNWLYKAELWATRDNPNTIGGIFDLSDARNPVRDWSFVFVPYCTGDVHTGSNTATYVDPATHERYTIQHRGADNFKLILAWMRANFDHPQEILVTGSSAGAYGAVAHFARIREAFPEGLALMLGDAGQSVTAPGFNAERNANWRYELPAQVYGANARPGDQDVVADLAGHYAHDRFAQYTTAYDRTQTGFYALMAPREACSTWNQTMTRALTAREQHANFRGYLAAGDSHTLLRSPLFYSEESGGGPFSQWLGAMVSGDGAGWTNRACTHCGTAPRRCSF